jgi:hypothetical protein
MRESIENVFSRLDPVTNTVAIRDVVAIRPAQDADLAPLHDLAELDSAQALTGPVLVAAVEGAVWAAIGLDDGRVIADPFRPSAGAVELLRVRRAQLRAAKGRGAQRGFALRGARRVRA